MIKKYYFLFVVILSLFLYGCKENIIDKSINEENTNYKIDNNESRDEEVGEIDVYDFYFINKAPISTEKHPLDELIKIYFSTKSVAVDLKNNELYEKPRYSTNGITTFEETLEFYDQEGLIRILKEYNVQKWKEDYTTEDSDTYDDGYGWLLLMQFEDGTVEKYKGSGPLKMDIIPENFDDFALELEEFIDKKINEVK